MKTLLAVALAASLVLNAAFAFLIFSHRTAPTPTAPVAAAPAAAGAPLKIDGGIWTSLGGEDLPTLVAQLRAAGFPPEILRAILAAQISESFTARRKALAPSDNDLPFWKTQPRDPKLELARRQLDREEQKLLRSLLGPDADSDDPMSRLYQNRNFSFLSAEKAVDLRTILRNYDEHRSDLYAAGYSQNTDLDKMTALDKDLHDRIAQLLTPAELLDYDMRTSRTGDQLRSDLEAFQPTEAEFRAIYQLRAPFDERFGQNFGLTLSADERRQRSDAEKLLTEQIKTTLSPERAAEYDRDSDYSYRRTSQLVARLELAPETTNNLWAIQQEFQQKQRDVYKGTTSREETVQRGAALQQEAIARVTPLLGTTGTEAYKQNGGQWLQNLAPRPAPAARPTAPKN